jgi:RNA polymerase sigma-70 factor, ECF subfamily
VNAEDFNLKFSKEIDEIFAQIGKRYSVVRQELALALHAAAEKYLFKPSPSISDKEVKTFFGQLNVEDLCFALACARGDEAAWDDFMREYRGFLQGVARQLISNETIAEELVETAWAELYGLRGGEGKRSSKFALYSGRGSLKGWLRAVMFQISIDQHRRQSRFVQPEEDTEFDRITPAVSPFSESRTSDLGSRYREATQKALQKALTDLEPKMKLMLSYYYYDNLTLKQIGELFRVHEATASRWLQRVQKDIRQSVEKILQRDYKFNSVQIKECLNFAAESEDVDVRSLLAEAEPPAVDRGS